MPGKQWCWPIGMTRQLTVSHVQGLAEGQTALLTSAQPARLPEVQMRASCRAGGDAAAPLRGSDTAILPQHSVMPYDTKKRHPKAAIAAATLAGGSGDPPQDSMRRLDRSALRSAGLLSSSVTMVEARFVTDTRSRSADATCLC